jgi:hypothetical protein
MLRIIGSGTVAGLDQGEESEHASGGEGDRGQRVSQFYITNDSELDIQRCNESRHSQNAIVIMAQTIGGSIKTFKGVV